MPRSTAIAPLTPSVAPASAARAVSGRTPTTTRTMSAARVTAEPSAAVAWTCSRPGWPAGARVIAWTVVPVSTSTPWPASSAWTSAPSSGSTVGSTSGSCSIWVTASPRTVRASAISRPMYPAPTMTALAGAVCSRVAHDGEGVVHRVQQVHAVVGAERAGTGQAADRGADRDRAGADDELVVAEQFLAAAGEVTRSLRPGTSMRRAVVSSRSRIPAASRSAMVRWARLRQWATSPET